MTKIILSGIGGKMGRAILALAKKSTKYEIVCGVDKAGASDIDVPVFSSFDYVTGIDADVIVDFSRPNALDSMLQYALKTKTNIVIATTGYTSEDLLKIVNASNEIAIFKASNMSLGVNLVANLVKQAAVFLGKDFDVEIIEQHHNQKIDAPSGTALTLAKKVNEAFDDRYKIIEGRSGANCKRMHDEISICSVRGGTIVGKHDVLFIGNNETVTISHEATSRDIFGAGALKAAAFLEDKEHGVYDMDNLIADMLG